MVKPLPPDDFRAVRKVLEPEDFAWGSDEPDPPPRDPIGERIWRRLVGLPDDVAIRTSDNFGTCLKDLCELGHVFVIVSLAIDKLVNEDKGSPLNHATTIVFDNFHASAYNALAGFYRLAFTSLRSVVENMTVGMQLELSQDKTRFQEWLAGEELKMGWAADLALKNPSVQFLENHLNATVQDGFFRQKTNKNGGGFSRRLFGRLSKFTHGGPGFNDADIRQSNGPVFVPEAFIEWAVAYTQTLAYSILACKLTFPGLNRIGDDEDETIAELYQQVWGMLRQDADGVVLFREAGNLLFH